MPYVGRRYRRRRAGRRFRRRLGRFQASASRYIGTYRRPVPVSRQLGCPDKMIVKWRFAIASGDINTITSTTGSVGNYVYRANSCYDPYQSGGGNQPRTFDQWMVMYHHGVVLGSKAVINFHFATGATSESAMRVYVMLKDSTTAPTAPDSVENRRSKSGVLLAQNSRGLKLPGTYTYKLVCHNPEDEDDLMFRDSADANQLWYYHIGGFALNGASEVCQFGGYIDYTVLLIHPLNPSQS